MLIANAGANFHAPVTELSENAWRTIVDINLDGTYRCCHAFAEAIAAADVGRVVTMSSVIGRDGAAERPLRGVEGRYRGAHALAGA